MREQYGNLWLQAADDLDNAIAEWGEWVEARIEERVNDAIERDRDRVAAAHKAGNSGARSSLNRDRLREISDEAWHYYVRRVLRQYVGDATGATDGGYREKPVTGDLRRDLDWSTDDVVYVSGTPTGRRAQDGGKVGA